jgi:teichuronopeptide biosynthesis TupA-like protein
MKLSGAPHPKRNKMRIPRADKRLFYWGTPLLTKLSLRLPEGRIGDKLFAFFLFLERQGRLPKGKDHRFADYLYDMKMSGELLSLPRQMISDKEYGKLFINDVLGGDYTIPTLKVLRSVDEVEEGAFPTDCVIKPAHASQQVIVRKNNEPIDLDVIRSFFDSDLYKAGREQNYRYLEHKIIVEPIVFGGEDFIEINVHCFKGRAKILRVKCEQGRTRECRGTDWSTLDLKFGKYPEAKTPVPKPEALDEILRAVETLASRFEYIRVDLYTTRTEFYIGELTNCHTNAILKFPRPGDEERFAQLLFGEEVDDT